MGPNFLLLASAHLGFLETSPSAKKNLPFASHSHSPLARWRSGEVVGLGEDLSEASLPPFLTATSARASSHLSAAAQIYVAV